MEVLFAFSVALLFTMPLVYHSFKYCGKELKCLEEMELQRLADLAFCEVKEMLLKNEIPWQQIPRKEINSDPVHMKNSRISMPGFKDKEVLRHFYLVGRGEKQGRNNEEIRQLGVHIMLNDHLFKFRTPVVKYAT